ncbi:hypothetical protein GQ53DRAFT_156019 [Thozetella sp. PMI_491]|nr:hypothetical protein GQ53DRAFT_156019 [Thozetella sp. PMI_491]
MLAQGASAPTLSPPGAWDQHPPSCDSDDCHAPRNRIARETRPFATRRARTARDVVSPPSFCLDAIYSIKSFTIRAGPMSNGILSCFLLAQAPEGDRSLLCRGTIYNHHMPELGLQAGQQITPYFLSKAIMKGLLKLIVRHVQKKGRGFACCLHAPVLSAPAPTAWVKKAT